MINSIGGVKASVPPAAAAGSTQIDEKKSYINGLSYDVERLIFSYLKLPDLRNVCLVDERRNAVVSTLPYERSPSLKDRVVYRDFAFNSKDWKTYCKKDVDTEGEDTFFSKNIYKELNKPCPAFPGKRIGQTHMVTWVPKTINGEPLTLNSFGGVLKEKFPENPTGYRAIWNPIVIAHGNTGVLKSGWVFMTGDVIPESRYKPYTIQEGLVANLDRHDPYEVPTTLKAVVCISTKYFKSGERRFSDKPCTYTRCQERTQSYPVIVGAFSAVHGPEVDDDRYGQDINGVGALRSSVLDT